MDPIENLEEPIATNWSEELISFITNVASRNTYTLRQLEPFGDELESTLLGNKDEQINQIVQTYYHKNSIYMLRMVQYLQRQNANVQAQNVALQAMVRTQRSRDSAVKWEVPKLTATKKYELSKWLEYKSKLENFGIQVGLREVFEDPENASPLQWSTLKGYLSQGCTGIATIELQKRPRDGRSQWERLQKYFEVRNETQINLLMEKYESIRINGHDTPSLTFSRIDEILEQLYTLGKTISEPDLRRHTIRLIDHNKLYETTYEYLTTCGLYESWSIENIRAKIEEKHTLIMGNALRQVGIIENQRNNERTRNPRRRNSNTDISILPPTWWRFKRGSCTTCGFMGHSNPECKTQPKNYKWNHKPEEGRRGENRNMLFDQSNLRNEQINLIEQINV